MEEDPLEASVIETSVLSAISAAAAKDYRERGYTDTGLRWEGGRRFRLNFHRERGRPAACIRALPQQPPRFEDLNLPEAVLGLTRLPYGLVLVGGPTGSGKSTTLAAFVNEINHRDRKHIVTIEDPIEYEHPQANSLVQQIEIGVDAPDFQTALRSTLRQAPDVIVVGEMRDPETMQIALTAGETGHLVFSTLHTGDVTSTVSRISDSFPPERQSSIHQDLSVSLAAVMTQVLLPNSGGGRVPAAELLMIGYGARQHIRKNAIQHLHQEISITRPKGSFSFEQSLAHLCQENFITLEEARERTRHRDELDIYLRNVRDKHASR
jgi:twitching motility protein PilT